MVTKYQGAGPRQYQISPLNSRSTGPRYGPDRRRATRAQPPWLNGAPRVYSNVAVDARVSTAMTSRRRRCRVSSPATVFRTVSSSTVRPTARAAVAEYGIPPLSRIASAFAPAPARTQVTQADRRQVSQPAAPQVPENDPHRRWQGVEQHLCRHRSPSSPSRPPRLAHAVAVSPQSLPAGRRHAGEAGPSGR